MNSHAGVRVGIVGVSWWADAMYLPSLAHHPIGRVTAMCGRDMDRTRMAADRWGVAHAFDNWRTMLDSGEIDAVIVASTNETHYDITMAALEQGLPVLCEKPIALTAEEATRMASAAAKAAVVTMVPFTYRYMPTNQYIKHLIDDGYIGRPYSLNMRYFTGFARDSAYAWRFDTEKSGSGIIGDLGTHWLDMARWFLGEVTSISASVEHFVPRIRRSSRSASRVAQQQACRPAPSVGRAQALGRCTRSISTARMARCTPTTTGTDAKNSPV
jgi:predicted dehydrogenase